MFSGKIYHYSIMKSGNLSIIWSNTVSKGISIQFISEDTSRQVQERRKLIRFPFLLSSPRPRSHSFDLIIATAFEIMYPKCFQSINHQTEGPDIVLPSLSSELFILVRYNNEDHWIDKSRTTSCETFILETLSRFPFEQQIITQTKLTLKLFRLCMVEKIPRIKSDTKYGTIMSVHINFGIVHFHLSDTMEQNFLHFSNIHSGSSSVDNLTD